MKVASTSSSGHSRPSRSSAWRSEAVMPARESVSVPSRSKRMVRPLMSGGGATADLGLHRVGDEALLVGQVVEVVHVRRGRALLPAVGDARVERHRGHPDGPALVLAHHAHRLVLVGLDDEALAHRHVEEGQHVTARDGGDEGLLGIDAGRARVGRRDHGGRRGRRARSRRRRRSTCARASTAPSGRRRRRSGGPSEPSPCAQPWDGSSRLASWRSWRRPSSAWAVAAPTRAMNMSH